MSKSKAPPIDPEPISAEMVSAYRRDGYIVVRGFLGPERVETCLAVLSDLARGQIPIRQTRFQFETRAPAQSLSADDRERFVRKYMDFVSDAPVLGSVGMDRRLHAILDQLLGEGRSMILEMAMVKPPRIGSEKPWHQDAAYFRIADPGLVAGVWIALDHATRANGCMEVLKGSHLDGPIPHVHENDLNLCRILPGTHPERERVAIEMQPGDALIFHSLLQHYTAPNTSELKRRALQFHYLQNGGVWCDAEGHKRVYHDAEGNYAGCTVLHRHLPGGDVIFPNPLVRAIELVDPPGSD